MNAKHLIRKISSLQWRESSRLNKVNYGYERGENLVHSDRGTKSAMTDVAEKDKIIAALSPAASPETNYSPLTIHYSLKQKLAFTLAEVLITLGIIGVVAALTLSTIISKYKEHVWVNKFKQTYSVLSELYMNAIEENGGTFPEDICTGITVKKQCSDKIVDFLIKDNSNIHKVNWQTAMPRYYYDIVNTKVDNQMYRTNYSWFMLNNGVSVGVEGSAISDDVKNNRYFPFMFVDLNGIAAPNKLGSDEFLLYLKKTPDGKYSISGYDLWWVGPAYCNPFKKVGGWTNGGACAIWLIRHGNMDYLHKEIKSW